MKKHLLFLSCVAIAASAAGQTSDAMVQNLGVNMETDAGNIVSNTAVFKNNLTLTPEKASTYQFLLQDNDLGYMEVSNLKAIYIKWSNKTGTNATDVISKLNSTTSTSGTTDYKFVISKDDTSGEKTILISDILTSLGNDALEESAKLKYLVAQNVYVRANSSITIDEFYFIDNNDVKIPVRSKSSDAMKAAFGGYQITAPAYFTIYKAHQGPFLYNPAETKNFSVDGTKDVTIEIKLDADMTSGQFYLQGIPEEGNNVTLSPYLNTANNPTDTWKVKVTKDKGAFKAFAIRLHNKSASIPGWIAINSITATIEGETTGIDSVAVPEDDENGMIYDLSGRMVGTSVEALAPGLYIRNGKKFVK